MGKQLIIALLCATLAVANCYLFPDEHELVYDYNTVISAGVIGKDSNDTVLVLNATVTLKSYQSLTFMTLRNVTYEYMLGEDSLLPPSDTMKLSEETLSIPYVIQYKSNGKIMHVVTDDKDQQWSVNIKTGIAVLFQLDLEKLSDEESTRSGFTSRETVMSGMCPVSYVVTSKEDTKMTITKQMSSASCTGQTWYSRSELPKESCRSKHVHPLTGFSKRTYNTVKINRDIIVESVVNEHTLTASPITGGSHIQSVLSKQTLTKVAMKELDDLTIPAMNNKVSGNLKANFNSDKQDTYDITGGRMTYDPTATIAELKRYFEMITSDSTTVNIGSTITKESHPTFDILKMMRMLNETELDVLCSALSGEASDKFHSMVSFVGTDPSIMFIINRIINKFDLSSDLATKMVRSIAVNWINPNEVTLRKFAVLFKPGSKLQTDLQVNIMFTLSSMISKVMDASSDEGHVNDLVLRIIDGFKSAKTETIQYKYILAMNNIGSTATTKTFLEEIVKGETNYVTPFVRSLAIRVLKDLYMDSKVMIERMFFPLISNSTENHHVRCAALIVYLAKPNIDKLLKIHSIMKTEENVHVLSMYWTSIKTLTTMDTPCDKQVLEYAKTLMQFKPTLLSIDALSFHIRYSPKASLTVTGNLYEDGYATFSFNPLPDVFDVLEIPDTYFLRIKLKTVVPMKRPLRTEEYFKKLINDLFSNDDLSFDLVSIRLGQVIDILEDFTPKTMMVIGGVFSEIQAMFDDIFILQKEVIVTSDIGLPIVYFTEKYTNYTFPFHLAEEKHKLLFDMDYSSTNSMNHGLKFYNPVANIWQGVKRSHTMNMEIPFNNTIDMQDTSVVGGLISVLFDHVKDGMIKTGGFETFVHSDIFVEDTSRLWKKDCPKCSDRIMLTQGHDHQKQYPIWNQRFDLIGTDFKFELFDCESELGSAVESHMRSTFLDVINKNLPEVMDHSLLFMMNDWIRNAFIMPDANVCGMRFVAKPDHTKTNINFKYDPFLKDIFLVVMNYTMHNTDATIKSWGFALNASAQSLEKTTESLSFVFTNDLEGKMIVTHLEADYKIDDFSTSGHYKVFTDGTDDNTDLTMHFNATLSEEQIMKNNAEKQLYSNCIKRWKPVSCDKELTYLRHYEHEINFKHISKEHRMIWKRVIYMFQMMYGSNLVYSENMQISPKDTVKIILQLPIATTSVDVTIVTESDSFLYKDIPLNSFFFKFIFKPISTHYSTANLMEIFLPKRVFCKAMKTSIINNQGEHLKNPMKDTWTELATMCQDKDSKCVYNYQIYSKWTPETKLALRVVTPGGTLEAFVQNDAQMKVLLNDKPVAMDEHGYYADSTYKIKIIDTPRMFLNVKGQSITVDFSSRMVQLNYLGKEQADEGNWSGLCF